MNPYRAFTLLNPMIITHDYYPAHGGIDLRSAKDAPCFLPEDCLFLRSSETNGLDGYGNTYVVFKSIKDERIFKYIHTTPQVGLTRGFIYKAGEIVGFTDEKGNSRGAHLHLSIWKNEKEFFDPKDYFNEKKIPFKFKGE